MLWNLELKVTCCIKVCNMNRLHRSGFGRKASPDPSAFQLIERSVGHVILLPVVKWYFSNLLWVPTIEARAYNLWAANQSFGNENLYHCISNTWVVDIQLLEIQILCPILHAANFHIQIIRHRVTFWLDIPRHYTLTLQNCDMLHSHNMKLQVYGISLWAIVEGGFTPNIWTSSFQIMKH